MRSSRLLAYILLVSYIVLLTYWMLLGFGRYTQPEYMYNLKPLDTIKIYMNVQYFNIETWIINVFGNIIVFIPFGILIPITTGRRFLGSLVTFELGLGTLELLQLLTKRGSLDIDDFFLNTVGFCIGYMLYRRKRGSYDKH